MSGTSPKVAIITGASSGIGRASSIALSKAGWSVALFARREEDLKSAAAECPSPTLVIVGDVTSEGDVKRLFEETVKAFGRLDLLFNNAGIAVIGTLIEDLPLEKYQAVLNVNVVGTFLCTKEAVRQYKKQSPQGGRIINNGSISAHTPRPHSISYTSSKHAVTGITKSTALDGRAFDISVTQIDIGVTLTTMAKPILVGAMQADGVVRPEAMMDVEYAADAVVYIAGLPNTVQVLEMNIMPTKMPFVGRG
ncbi:hypothetical protein M422DRAFT_35799 [Sphaerobolus stellatus SS14]|uniref:3-oxoacyl-[acyl-carrier-protein] reductase n=1 Tax=Sphaerobolus stellatus (strain SS14) TaxID=990650 RepID=A0A0C9V4U6_SPHS4|nr:hypothetical protein M422DRAFT_35799 [Sphaerobolus stellatus SS14]